MRKKISFALVFAKAVLNEGASPRPLEAGSIYLNYKNFSS